MNESENKTLSEEKEYANAYYYFNKVLVILAANAEEQCEAMGNFNVAWEIRDDASSGASTVLSLPGGDLSKEQREGVEQLLTIINAVPDSVVNVSNAKQEHIRAMSNQCWTSVRTRARKLITLLESETTRINALLDNVNR